jgi:hypothetical protein
MMGKTQPALIDRSIARYRREARAVVTAMPTAELAECEPRYRAEVPGPVAGESLTQLRMIRNELARRAAAAGEVPPAARDALRALAAGRGCPAGVAEVLDRIASGRAVTSHDIAYVTGDMDDSQNFYARIRAAGVDVAPGDMPMRRALDRPSEVMRWTMARGPVRRAARDLAAAIDHAAEVIAAADIRYARALGWMG